MKRPIAILFAALIALPVVAGAGSQSRDGDDGQNVLVTLALTEGQSRRPIQAIVLDGQRVRTTSGWRVPIGTKVTARDGESAQSTEIQYQDVGMGMTLHARIVASGRIRVSGEVDLSTIPQAEALPSNTAITPTVTAFRHVFDVVVTDGDGIRLAEVPRPESGSVVLTLTADIEE